MAQNKINLASDNWSSALEGKITATSIIKKLSSERAFGKHSTSPPVLSLTQPTEVGTVYTVPKNVLKRVYFLFRSLIDRPVCVRISRSWL